MPPESDLATVAHVIQLAIAPVFLLTGIGALLSVLTGRMARVIDRARVLEVAFGTAAETKQHEMESELIALSRRSRLINQAISLVTTSAILVCAVIAALFFDVFFSLDLSTPVGLVFIASMLALIGGLVAFLGEVRVAIKTSRIGPPRRKM